MFIIRVKVFVKFCRIGIIWRKWWLGRTVSSQFEFNSAINYVNVHTFRFWDHLVYGRSRTLGFISASFVNTSVISCLSSSAGVNFGTNDGIISLGLNAMLTQLQPIDIGSQNPSRASMLLSLSRVKPLIRNGMAYISTHRRLLLFVFLVVPFVSYLFAWALCTTEAFFPRPLRQSNEVLIVVAHPDDECIAIGRPY